MTQGKPKLGKVTIDGIDASSFVVSSDLNPQIGQVVKSIIIDLHRNVYNSIPNLQSSPNNLTVVVQRGVTVSTEQTIFQGKVVQRDTVGNRVVLKCNDNLFEAVKKNVTKTFDKNVDTEAGKISDIFITLVGLAGLTADSSSVTDSGTVIVLDKFICNNVDIIDRLEVLVELLNWQLFYNSSDDKVYLQPKGARSGTNTLTIGINVLNRPRWIRDGTKVVKKAVIFGGPIDTQTQESFNGDGAETEFTLTKIARNVKVTVDGTLQTGGAEDQSVSGTDYFLRKVIKSGTDTQVSQIKFDSGSIPGAGANNVVVDYTFASPITISDENTVSDGLETRIDKPDLITVEDCRIYLTKFMERHSEDFLRTTLAVTNITDMEVGQSVRVVDTHEGIDDTFTITKLRKRFPYAFDEVTVDNEPLDTEDWEISIEDRIRRIEERLLEEETLVIFNRTAKRTIKIGREWTRKDTRDITGDELIWGNVRQGIWNTNKWANSKSGSEATVFLQQGGDVYVEDFLNTDFDSGGNATWASSGSVTFTAGQVAESTSIDFANGTITQVILTSTEESGSFLYEVTANYVQPIAHYKLNDNLATTNVIDSAGSNDGTATFNTSDNSVTGKINNALTFNGSTDWVDTGALVLSKGTFSLWLKATNINDVNDGRFLVDEDNNGLFFFQDGTNNVLRFFFRNAVASDIFKNITLSDVTDWTLITVTFDSSGMNFYENGVLKDTLSNTNSWTLNVDHLQIGGRASRTFDGTLDDVRIYNKVLSQAEISLIYNSGSGTEENATWETTTSGATHIFTNTGTDLRWRATENGASTGEISELKLESYH